MREPPRPIKSPEIKSVQIATTKTHALSQIRQKVAQAMRDPDRIVCKIVYHGSDGEVTTRRVSPTSWTNRRVFKALCLGRGEPRQFTLSQIESIEHQPASDVLAPEGVQCDAQ